MQLDFFSAQSAHYATYRPVYPDDLYAFIQSQLHGTDLAWDVGTGNGQAAARLAGFMKQVYASDLSDQQLSHARQLPNIDYRHERAEDCSLPVASADLVTVATALHWFDLPAFYKRVDEVLKPGGFFITWSYGGCRVNDDIDPMLDHFNFDVLYDYWHEGARINWDDRYRSLPWPYATEPFPDFTARARYTMEELLLYMYSWSGVQTYIQQHGVNPLMAFGSELKRVWGDPNERREIRWPLHGKCSHKPG